MFQYAYARAYAEGRDMDLTTSDWIGQQIFDIPVHHEVRTRNCEVLPTEYHQDQASLIYTRKQVKEWFRFKPWIFERMSGRPNLDTVAHLRRGDYKDLGYVVVSKESYLRDFTDRGFAQARTLCFLSEEEPYFPNPFPSDVSFVADFYVMVNATILYRANSSFSWWAATLSSAKVYSPVIEGLEGGREQDCKFIEGNWPRFANLPFVTDLHL